MWLPCTPPARQTDYVPDAAGIKYVDFCLWNDGDYEAQLVFTVTMRNGDVIRVRQTHHFHAVKTYTYTPKDSPMNTLEDLRALLEEINRTAEPDADIDIRLPPVTYEGELMREYDIRDKYELHNLLKKSGPRTTAGSSSRGCPPLRSACQTGTGR